ncbi:MULTISPECIES: AAA family ATPase [unclassified Roseivivax]|uniref:AAA family ATPase n=1 Tax=Roseivivax sp. GX 12232 TaxID=2900547 RepID=UPI001E5AF3F1|nr:AAA family ATPase [Roseivivax sp. GX 12232]MCE0504065.1 uridine kinase [Roseivivax sp. GX 12232]
MAALDQDTRAVLELIGGRARAGARSIIAIAGPPGSGKSTLAAEVVDRLNQETPGRAALLPMDGFHLENPELVARGLLAQKGAPETFDAESFLALIREIRAGGRDIAYPLFDRARDCTLPDAGFLRAEVPLVVVEGNYLLLGEGAWGKLAAEFDASVMIAPPIEVLEDRLIRRWLDHGLPREAAEARARGNDLPNARLVVERSRPADLRLGQDAKLAP